MAINPTEHALNTGSTLSGAGEIFAGLVVVVLAIFAVAWLMRRLQPGLIGGATHMRILSALAVGPRERVLLVDVAGTQILLGVTATQITPLHQFSEPVAPLERQGATDFALRLRQAIGAGKSA